MIWTSRFANKELNNNEKYYPVAISVGLPRYPLKYLVMEQCLLLAPTRAMLKMELDEYEPLYKSKLTNQAADVILAVRKLEETATKQGKELVLLCHEDIRHDDKWCHRTLFADWWKLNTGEKISELKDESVIRVKKVTEPKIDKNAPIKGQVSLF